MRLDNYPNSTQSFAGMIILSRLTSHIHDQVSYEMLNNLRQQIAIEHITGKNKLSKAHFGLEIAAIMADHAVKIANYLLSEDSENDKS